ncbi:MAG: hypothetical protein KDE00_12195 [Rhodobacteraceae bacterium]|nr:hypothetical protein [Paracoccaceae bacterium]
MKGIGLVFFASAAFYGLAGMCLGLWMGGQQDFTLAPVHAHLNLLGFVTMALVGFFYHLTPAAAGRLAKVHFGMATLGLWLMIPGIGLAVTGRGEAMAIVGSLVTVASMALFVVNLGLSLRPSRRRDVVAHSAA